MRLEYPNTITTRKCISKCKWGQPKETPVVYIYIYLYILHSQIISSQKDLKYSHQLRINLLKLHSKHNLKQNTTASLYTRRYIWASRIGGQLLIQILPIHLIYPTLLVKSNRLPSLKKMTSDTSRLLSKPTAAKSNPKKKKIHIESKNPDDSQPNTQNLRKRSSMARSQPYVTHYLAYTLPLQLELLPLSFQNCS